MHVVVVDSTITTPPTGGAHTFLVELCAALAGRGHRVALVTEPGPERALTDSVRGSGVEVVEDVWRAVHLPEERAARLAAWVNGRGADVYLVSVSPDAGWLALPLLDARVGTVSVAHGDSPAFYEPVRHYRDFVDCAVGVSRETLRKIVSRCGVPPERARQIPYGVASLSPEEMEARVSAGSAGPLRVGYVGRIVSHEKRVLGLAPLAEEMRRRGFAFELHVVGDGPERPALEEGFRARGVEGHVKLWGWLSPAEVKARLRELDALVLLSDHEGLPVAMLEAMGHGVVPVVTRIDSGNVELVREGENGLLAEVDDFAGFAGLFGGLARDRARLASMSRAAWETGRGYGVGRMLERYLEAFDAIKGGGPRAPRPDARGGYPLMPSTVSRYPVWVRKIKRRVLVAAGRGRY
jgi:glycosyltransferase involved in cell wall biosynthesis